MMSYDYYTRVDDTTTTGVGNSKTAITTTTIGADDTTTSGVDNSKTATTISTTTTTIDNTNTINVVFVVSGTKHVRHYIPPAPSRMKQAYLQLPFSTCISPCFSSDWRIL